MVRCTREQGDLDEADVNRLPASLVGVVLLVVAAWASIGCDSDSFVPPPPDELRGVVGGGYRTPRIGSAATADLPGMPAAGKAIELILDRHGADETEVVKAAARTQAGHDKARLKIAVLGEQGVARHASSRAGSRGRRPDIRWP